MATRVLDGIKFCEQVSKRTTQRTFLPILVYIGPAVWEELIFKEIVDDERKTPGNPKKLPLSMLCSGELKTFNQGTFL